MSPQKLERITGHVVAVSESGRNFSVVCDCDEVAVLLEETGVAKEALGRLLYRIYQHHAHIVHQRQGYRCIECGHLRALETDHIVARSKGRDDRVANLRASCHNCHSIRHRGKA